MPDAGIIALLIPIGLVVVLPLVAILTHHQRKMAEVFAKNQRAASDPEIAMLRSEIRELKELVHQQAIALDGRTSIPPAVHDFRDRLVS